MYRLARVGGRLTYRLACGGQSTGWHVEEAGSVSRLSTWSGRSHIPAGVWRGRSQ